MKYYLIILLIGLMQTTAPMERENILDSKEQSCSDYEYYCAAHVISEKIYQLAQETKTLTDSITLFKENHFDPSGQTKKGLVLEFFHNFPICFHMPLGTWKFARTSSVRGNADEMLKQKIVGLLRAGEFEKLRQSPLEAESALYKDRILLYTFSTSIIPMLSFKKDIKLNPEEMKKARKHYQEIEKTYQKDDNFYPYLRACKLIKEKLKKVHDTIQWRERIQLNHSDSFEPGTTAIEQGLLLKGFALTCPLGTWTFVSDLKSYGNLDRFYNEFLNTFTKKIVKNTDSALPIMENNYKVTEVDDILLPEVQIRQLSRKIEPSEALAIWQNLTKRYAVEESIPQ